MTTCIHCGSDVPGTRFCLVCGLEQGTGDAITQRRFAGNPAEHAVSVRLVSTLLPRLPKAHMVAFQASLAIGVAVVLILAALGFFPLALAAGAFVVPLLMIVYIYDVDDYEDEPVIVTVFTVAWGAVAGAAFGFLLRAMFPASNPFLTATVPPTTLFLQMVVMPLIAGALMLIGPLVLLPYRKFNDVLDGATFGATAGVTFAGAQVIVQSLDLFQAGLQPGGDTFSWVMRIVLHSVLIPVIAGGAIGACAGAFWLRYRAPVRDRARLGPVGRPIVALLLAAALLVASTVALVLLRDLVRLVVELAIAALALIWLRLVIHLGLIEEAVEMTGGPAVVCENCGRTTPSGAFCGQCGVALRALPKRAGGAVAPTATPSSPSSPPPSMPPPSAPPPPTAPAAPTDAGTGS